VLHLCVLHYFYDQLFTGVAPFKPTLTALPRPLFSANARLSNQTYIRPSAKPSNHHSQTKYDTHFRLLVSRCEVRFLPGNMFQSQITNNRPRIYLRLIEANKEHACLLLLYEYIAMHGPHKAKFQQLTFRTYTRNHA